LDGIAGPVQRGGLTQERTAAAVEQAADNLVPGVVVRRARVLIEVEAGVAADTLAEESVVWVRESLDIEGRQALPIMEPVEHDGELLVVHAIAGKGDVLRPGGGVLAEMPFPRFLVEAEDVIRPTQGVQDRPVRAVLDGVVRAVVSAPALDTAKVAA